MMQQNQLPLSLTISSQQLQKVWLSVKLLKMTIVKMTATTKMKHALVAWKLKHKLKLAVVVEEVVELIQVHLLVVLVAHQSVAFQAVETVAQLVVVEADSKNQLIGSLRVAPLEQGLMTHLL
jgi:hypothetical protein